MVKILNILNLGIFRRFKVTFHFWFKIVSIHSLGYETMSLKVPHVTQTHIITWDIILKVV